MKEAIIKRNNIHITGNPNAKETIVFGHGFGTDQTSFSEVVKFFSDDYRIVLYDNVGGGKADINAFSPLRYNTLYGYVGDLKDIFEATGLLKMCTSWGIFGKWHGGHAYQYSIPGVALKSIILLGASPRYLNDAATSYVPVGLSKQIWKVYTVGYVV